MSKLILLISMSFFFSGYANWEKIDQDIDGEAASDYSGSSVSLSADGSVVAIGARLNNGNGTIVKDRRAH